MKKLCCFFLLLIFLIANNCTGPKIELRFNVKPGTIYTYKVTTDQLISQTIKGQVLDMNQTIIMEHRYEVIEINDAGNTIVEIVYDKVGYMQDGPLGKIEYRSWEDTTDIPMIARGFASLVGQEFLVEISSQGSVVDVKGTDKIIKKMLEDLDLPAVGAMKEEMERNMRNQFGDDAFKENMKSMFNFYPDRPVGVGDSWQATWRMSKGFPMILHNTWKITKMNETEVFLDVYTKVESNKAATLMQIGGIEMSYDLSGEQKGTVVVDRETGWCTKSHLEQTFEGMIRTSGGMFGAQDGMEWPIEVAGTITIESTKE